MFSVRQSASKEEILTAAYQELAEFDRTREVDRSTRGRRTQRLILFAFIGAAILIGCFFLLRK